MTRKKTDDEPQPLTVSGSVSAPPEPTPGGPDTTEQLTMGRRLTDEIPNPADVEGDADDTPAKKTPAKK